MPRGLACTLISSWAVVIALTAGCGPARNTAADGIEPTFVSMAPSEVTTKIVGATQKQKEILLTSLSGVGDERIATITLEEAEKGWGEPGGVALRFTPTLRAARDMRMSWEAWLIADAFDVRSRELELPPVAYSALPDEASAIGDATREMAGRGTRERVDAFVRRVEREAPRADAEIEQIEVLKPLDYAVAITLRVSDPAAFLDRRAPGLFEALGEPPGDFQLRFVDWKGARIAENWHAGAGGAVWVRQDLDGCSPYLVSQPTRYEPPPCPAK